MKVSQANRQLQSFGSYIIFDNADGQNVLNIVEKHFPSESIKVDTAATSMVKPRLDRQERRIYEEKLGGDRRLIDEFKKYLRENAPLLQREDVEGLSKRKLRALVTITRQKFNAFVKTYNTFNPHKKIKL